MNRVTTTPSIEFVEEVRHILDQVYSWSRAQNYRGWNKHDGLNSPILWGLFGWGKWPRIAAVQLVTRTPINLRPLLLIPHTYNPKGLALFNQGLIDLYNVTSDKKYLVEATTLIDTLENLKSKGDWHGNCWGYHYPWQDPGFFAPTGTPNAVVTSFVCEAYLEMFRVTQDSKYLDTVGDAIPFFREDLKVLKDESKELCLSYMPVSMTMRVMDVSILIGSVIAQYCHLSGRDDGLKNTAHRLVNYVVNQQTEYDAWFYTDPPQDSHITHDNYHTGFILDALDRYMKATSDWSFEKNYSNGLAYYAEHFFSDEGAPRWMYDTEWPHDIHGAAQGILTFGRHLKEYPELSVRVARWAIDRMYNPEGRFYYQETRRGIKRFTLLRWCNAWMCRALSRLLFHLGEQRNA